MVTITNKQQKWEITKKEYYKDRAKWDSRGKVEIDKDLEKQLLAESDSINLKVDPEVLITPKKNAKKKTKQ